MSDLTGIRVLLMGESGSGKTDVIRTLIEAGVTPFVIFTEPGMATLAKYNYPPEKLHWKYIAPAQMDWGVLKTMARKVNTMSFESLTKMSDPDRSKYGQFMEVLDTCNNFVCDRDGQSYGDVASWGADKALVLDSLSGLNQMIFNLTVGGRPTAAMPDWMIAQRTTEAFLTPLTAGLLCHFVLIAHIEMEKDEVLGGMKLMVSALGRKLAPKIPRYFDDVIMTTHSDEGFFWATAAGNVALKSRWLPDSNKIIPGFGQIIDAWKKAGGSINPTTED